MGTTKVSRPEARDEKTDVCTTMASSSDQPSSVASNTLLANAPKHQASGGNTFVQVADAGAPAPTRLPQGQTATSATTAPTTPTFGNTVQTGRTVTHPVQGNVTVATANITTNQTQQSVSLPSSVAASNQHNHTAPQFNAAANHPQIQVTTPPPRAAINQLQAHVTAPPPRAAFNQLQAHVTAPPPRAAFNHPQIQIAAPTPHAAINHLQAHVAAPPLGAAAINHPQVRVVALPPTAATNNVQFNTAAPPPNAPNIGPQIHATAPPPDAATRNIHVQVAAPPPNAAMTMTHPHPPIAAHPPHAPINPFHPPVAAFANQPPHIITNAIIPNHNRPFPIFATRVVVRPFARTHIFRTSDNRIYASYGHVDPGIWSQLQPLGVPDGRQTLLSNHGTLYVRGPDPISPTAPWPQPRTPSPDATAGRKRRDSEPELPEPLGPSEADVPDPFFSVEASGAAVPKEEINTDELVERFKEFCSTEGGRESLGENLKGWLKGDLRYDAVEGMLVPRGEGEREGEGEEERRAQNADVTDGCLIC